MADRRKIIFFATEDWYFCSHRLALAKAAVRQGYSVCVMTRVRKHGDAIAASGARLIPLDMTRRGGGIVRELRLLLDLWRIYRQERPDLVHHVALKPVLYGSLAARLAGVPKVVNALAGLGHLFTCNDFKARLLRSVVSSVLRVLLRAGRVIVQNPDDLRLVIDRLGVSSERTSLILGAGVDVTAFSPVPEPVGATPLVVLASRMIWPKGIGEFVTAAEILRGKSVQARFALVGVPDPDNPRSIPICRLEEWREHGEVEWWGHKDDMPAVFGAASVVCLPSFYGEGVPKVLIEAAACGRPIVTTETPGCREIVRHGENGFLVPAKDAKALATAVESLLHDPALRRRMGEAGRRIVEQEFSLDKVIAETMAIYEEELS